MDSSEKRKREKRGKEAGDLKGREEGGTEQFT